MIMIMINGLLGKNPLQAYGFYNNNTVHAKFSLIFFSSSASRNGCYWRLIPEVNELNLLIRALLRKPGNNIFTDIRFIIEILSLCRLAHYFIALHSKFTVSVRWMKSRSICSTFHSRFELLA